ncbi:MAG TPA: VWA domain-containing protein [Vicinamibacterales bacterium]|nr:VWA domain-containing protein [Vicinamibacterales bacterium]
MFEIYQGGRRQTIADFRFVSIPVAERDIAAVRNQPDIQNVASNVQVSPDSRLFVLLVDDLHTLEYEIVQVKQVMTDFVRALSPADEVAVVFAGRSDLSVNFTTDPARMLRAIDNTREAFGFAIDALGRSANEDRGMNGRAMTAPGRAVAFAFKNAARALAGSGHPRRAIVYVSGGSPIDHEAANWTHVVSEDLRDAFETARRSNVPIYSLDPRGLAQPADVVRGGIGAIGGGGATSTYGVMKQIQVQQANLSAASINTGGRAFVNQSDLAGAIKAIVRENGSFYVLGYYPSPAPKDGRFHPIEVKVTRPGVRVRARPGYTSASAAGADESAADRLAAAMSSGVDMRGLTLRAHVAPLLPFDKVMRSTVTIQVTYPTIDSELPFDEVKVQIAALDADGKVRASSDRGYTFRAPRSERASATFLINGSIDLPAQPLTVRIGVSSRALGRTGTLQIPVTVPKPSDDHLQMGAAVIGLTGPPRESALGDVLVRGLVPFQPTTTRLFSPRATLRVFVPLFWRGREEMAKVTLTLKGEAFTAQREESLAASAGDKGLRLTSLDTLIPLAKFAGPVTLQIQARLPNGQTAQQAIGFDVRR